MPTVWDSPAVSAVGASNWNTSARGVGRTSTLREAGPPTVAPPCATGRMPYLLFPLRGSATKKRWVGIVGWREGIGDAPPRNLALVCGRDGIGLESVKERWRKRERAPERDVCGEKRKGEGGGDGEVDVGREEGVVGGAESEQMAKQLLEA
jgi:hypothetical protein